MVDHYFKETVVQMNVILNKIHVLMCFVFFNCHLFLITVFKKILKCLLFLNFKFCLSKYCLTILLFYIHFITFYKIILEVIFNYYG